MDYYFILLVPVLGRMTVPPRPPQSGPVVPNNVTSFGNKVFADMIMACAKVVVITGGPNPSECPEEGRRRQTDSCCEDRRSLEYGVRSAGEQGPSEAGGDAEGSLLETQRHAVPWHPDFWHLASRMERH